MVTSQRDHNYEKCFFVDNFTYGRCIFDVKLKLY